MKIMIYDPEDNLQRDKFVRGNSYLFLGEIENMPGHCVVVLNGKIVYGYHSECFREPKQDEL